jgi:hypothetical protein
MRLHGRIVLITRLAAQHAARRIVVDIPLVVFRPVRPFGFLFGVEVIEIAEELVEAMDRRQIFVAVAEMVFAELPGGVAQRFERLRDRYVTGL